MLIVATEFITPVNMLKLVTHRLNTTQTHKKGKKYFYLMFQATHFSRQNSRPTTAHFQDFPRSFHGLYELWYGNRSRFFS